MRTITKWRILETGAYHGPLSPSSASLASLSVAAALPPSANVKMTTVVAVTPTFLEAMFRLEAMQDKTKRSTTGAEQDYSSCKTSQPEQIPAPLKEQEKVPAPLHMQRLHCWMRSHHLMRMVRSCLPPMQQQWQIQARGNQLTDHSWKKWELWSPVSVFFWPKFRKILEILKNTQMSEIFLPNLCGNWKSQKPNFLQLGTVLWEPSLNTLCEFKVVQLEQEYLENYIYTLDATKGSKCACALQGAPIIVKEFNIFWFDKTLQSCHRQSWMWQ